MRPHAFAHSKMMFAAIAAAMSGAFLLGPVAQRMALEGVLRDHGPYRSRGKGRGTPSRNYGNGSGHTPHQGVRERGRRRAGGFAAQRRAEALA